MRLITPPALLHGSTLRFKSLISVWKKNCGSTPHSDAQVDWLYNLTPTFNSTTHQNTLKTWVASFGLWRAMRSFHFQKKERKMFPKGWFCSFYPEEGEQFSGERTQSWQKWHTCKADLRLFVSTVSHMTRRAGREGVTCSQTAVEVVQLSYFLVCVWSHEDSFI